MFSAHVRSSLLGMCSISQHMLDTGRDPKAELGRWTTKIPIEAFESAKIVKSKGKRTLVITMINENPKKAKK